MEAVVNESSVLRPWFLKLADIFPKYGTLDRRYAVLSNEVDGLRSRLYAAERQAEAFKAVVKALCTAVGTTKDLKRIYQVAASYLDDGGFNLFDAAREITDFCLSGEFPYEDACGCFEFLDGSELLRYLKASEFGAVSWETVPGTDCKKAILREVDVSTPTYQEFERPLYKRALECLGLCAVVPPEQVRQT